MTLSNTNVGIKRKIEICCLGMINILICLKSMVRCNKVHFGYRMWKCFVFQGIFYFYGWIVGENGQEIGMVFGIFKWSSKLC